MASHIRNPLRKIVVRSLSIRKWTLSGSFKKITRASVMNSIHLCTKRVIWCIQPRRMPWLLNHRAKTLTMQAPLTKIRVYETQLFVLIAIVKMDKIRKIIRALTSWSKTQLKTRTNKKTNKRHLLMRIPLLKSWRQQASKALSKRQKAAQIKIERSFWPLMTIAPLREFPSRTSKSSQAVSTLQNKID